jgi:NADPH:quinone reductase-like Zn-dependent oxidoreductase
MKAAVAAQYGGPEVIEISEIEKPAVSDEQVLVRVRAGSLNAMDWYGLIGLGIARVGGGMSKPKDTRIGTDFAGVVEAVGSAVTQFKAGDEVFGAKGGSLAEYVAVGQDRIALKPVNASFEQAAAVPVAGLTALQGLRDHGQLKPGQQVLINGAGGGVGSFTVQLAKSFGAQVTAVCGPANVDLVRSLGADEVVDYTRADFTLGEKRYDLFLDIAGGRTWGECRRILKPEARFVIIGGPRDNRMIGPLAHILKLRLAAMGSSQKVGFFIASVNRKDLLILKEMIEAGSLKPAIDQAYMLSETVQAFRHMQTGHIRGKIVITVAPAADQ